LRETIERFRAEQPSGIVTDETLAAALHDVGSTLGLVDRAFTCRDAG
jgi:hypothetical protein